MVVGVFAILKAGGAYVPFDPAYPKERQGFMLEDSGVRVLLTSKTLLNQFPDIAQVAEGVELIDLDEEWDVISLEAAMTKLCRARSMGGHLPRCTTSAWHRWVFDRNRTRTGTARCAGQSFLFYSGTNEIQKNIIAGMMGL